ncbi:hypothetical protein [Streptomyces sp. 8N706]|uniref:hypothetical protein n=1 Tax=Streptomyces sp. 8N706 TaxID=3457416 RepID=UPI003FCF66FC
MPGNAAPSPAERALADLLDRIRTVQERCGDLPGGDVVLALEEWAAFHGLTITPS